jgi:hypothetical protein
VPLPERLAAKGKDAACRHSRAEGRRNRTLVSYRYRWMRHGWLRKPLVVLSLPIYVLFFLPDWWMELRSTMYADWNGE